MARLFWVKITLWGLHIQFNPDSPAATYTVPILQVHYFI